MPNKCISVALVTNEMNAAWNSSMNKITPIRMSHTSFAVLDKRQAAVNELSQLLHFAIVLRLVHDKMVDGFVQKTCSTQ